MKLVALNGNMAWAAAADYIARNSHFRSVTGITYQAELRNDLIAYRGGNRNNGEEETIARKDFIEAFNAMRNIDEINTNTIKRLITNTLYRKRTPFIGLLYSAEILKK